MIFLVIILFFITSFLSISIKKIGLLEKIVFSIIAICLILISGFRTPGLDYVNYIDIYNDNYTKAIEPAIILISSVLKSIFNNPISLFIVFATLGVSFKMIAIHQLTEFWFSSLAIYVSYYFMYHEMIQIRAGIVSGLLLLSIKPIYDRNIKRFLIYFILALTFHISALLILPLWFLKSVKFNKVVYSGIIVFSYLLAITSINVSFVISYIPIERVQLLYQGYIQTTQQGIQANELNIFSALQLMRVAICLFLIFFIDNISEYNKYARILIKTYTLSISSYVLFSDLPVVAVRSNQLLGIVEVISIPLMIYAFTEKSRKIARLFPILAACAMLCLILFYRRLLS